LQGTLGRSKALEPTQPVTVMNTMRYLLGGKGGGCGKLSLTNFRRRLSKNSRNLDLLKP